MLLTAIWVKMTNFGRMILAILCLIIAVPALAAPIARTDAQLSAAIDCKTLLAIDFTRDAEAPLALTGAAIVPPAAGTPEFCAITGYVAPQVQFELRLPTKSWNGRYFQVGCGGFCGMIAIQNCGDVLAKDFAVAASNMGHVGNFLKEPLWGADPTARRDFGVRSTHVTALAAKRILAAYYGATPRFSYFRGCSTGGRQGLSEAQHYPGDFDGIVAGDPAFAGRLGAIANVWDAQHLFGPGNVSVFTKPALALLHRAVIAACDGVDGVKDGILSNPRACRFDVATLTCTPGRSECLTATQVAAAKAVYDGPRDSKGKRLAPGGALFGSEALWGGEDTWTLPEGSLRYLMFGQNPPFDYSYRSFDFDRDPARVKEQVALYDPVAPGEAPNLAAFHARGGKLVVYHGWADQGVSPLATLDYYGQVASALGGMARIRDWFRLFMVPGMHHCRGGDAPNTFNFMPSVMAWVEHGMAPDAVVATQREGGKVVRTRPLMAYPEVAAFNGNGDVNQAANWHSAMAAAMPDDRIAWNWGPTVR